LGISMAICELDADRSLCKDLKVDIVRVYLESVEGYEQYAEYDEVVPLERAKAAFDDWDAFLKRNRIPEDVDFIYMEKVKKEKDIAVLSPMTEKRYTGWIELANVPESMMEELMEKADDDNRLSGWDMLSFDEMNETCAKCGLSWDKGRGCIGTFGPESSVLPEIAKKRGLRIVASVLECAQEQRKLSPGDAAELLTEVGALREALPEEGKVMVRRYSGVLDRLEAMASVCQENGCRFYFL
jgi:hypothetical protein